MTDNEGTTKKEIKEVQNALEKRDDDNNQPSIAIDGACATCPVCKHPASKKANEIYFDNNKNWESVSLWFNNKYKKTFASGTMQKHFKEHVDPFVGQFMVMKEKTLKELEKRIANTSKSSNKIAMVKEMLFDMITDVYAFKTKQLSTKEDRVNYQRDAKMITDLAKSFREYNQMEFDLLGLGKTEEEQKNMMKNYVAGMLKQIVSAFDDMPDAQKRLSDLMKLTSRETAPGEE